MNLHSYFAVIATVTLLPSLGMARPGPEIPAPKTSLTDASSKVQAYFIKSYESDPADPDFDRFKRECIVTVVQYCKTYWRGVIDHPERDIQLDEWSWVVTLVHPRQNDHSWVFQYRADGTIKLLTHSI